MYINTYIELLPISAQWDLSELAESMWSGANLAGFLAKSPFSASSIGLSFSHQKHLRLFTFLVYLHWRFGGNEKGLAGKEKSVFWLLYWVFILVLGVWLGVSSDSRQVKSK